MDKPDVRFVAHLEPPRSLEAYHQETGRAGRDGLPADAWMTYGLQDFAIMRSMINGNEADDRRKFVEHRKLDAIMAFLETPSCRRQALLSYFGESIEPCANCDTCSNPPDTWDGTVAAQKALSNIFRTGQRFGAKHLANVLKGKHNGRTEQFGHDQLSTFGIGEELSNQEWRSVYRQLASSGLLDVDIEGHGGLKLNERSWQVLRGEKSVTLRTDPIMLKPSRRKTKGERIDEDGAISTSEARQLFEALRAKRQELAEERGVPPYAVFTDRTLLEMVRYRPKDLDEISRLSGIGAVKLESFGGIFLDLLKGHEALHGRPDDVPMHPKALDTAKQKSSGPNETVRETATLFKEYGDVETVAQKRALKPSTIWGHLTQAVTHGLLDWQQACALSEEEVSEIRDAITAFRSRGIMELTPVHEELGGRFDYPILRLVRAGLMRKEGMHV
ncbi:RQC domain-containing protein [Salidesulfovibrio brasiliensis]|uniref:RQC domain-containing protein n=1 Tax=Salidesulfovibrio brasiliensis TaxID=221711 RepID=UPI0034E1E161